MKNKLQKCIDYIVIAVVSLIIGAFLTNTFVNPERIVVKAQENANKDIDYLMVLADTKLKDLLRSDYWSHDNSDGCTWQCRVESTPNRPDLGVGENLYYGKCDLKYSIELWEKSPTHKAVLDAGYSNMVILSKQKGDICYVVYDVTFK